jgi:hypothetical protein
MSESQLQKEFREEDIQRMRNIISGNTAMLQEFKQGTLKNILNVTRAIYGKKTVKHGL